MCVCRFRKVIWRPEQKWSRIKVGSMPKDMVANLLLPSSGSSPDEPNYDYVPLVNDRSGFVDSNRPTGSECNSKADIGHRGDEWAKGRRWSERPICNGWPDRAATWWATGRASGCELGRMMKRGPARRARPGRGRKSSGSGLRNEDLVADKTFHRASRPRSSTQWICRLTVQGRNSILI